MWLEAGSVFFEIKKLSFIIYTAKIILQNYLKAHDWRFTLPF